MEDSAIREGFENLRPGAEYDLLYEAALCRAKADWLVGISGTRLFSTLYRKTLNIGRVMTPTLALVVDRETAISDFKKEKFYTVVLDCGKFTAASERCENRKAADHLSAACSTQAAVVQSVEKKQKSTQPPKLYDLTSLQRDGNRLFGYTAQQVLDYAQALYEKKLLTYPRTDSNYLTEDMKDTIPALCELAASALPFSVAALSVDAPRVINNGKVSDHHALLPTKQIYHLVEQEDYLLVDGLHEAIISEETWQAAQIKLLAQAKKYEHVNKGKDTRTHLLSGIVKCPICGAGMYGNKCIKHKKDGTKYKDFYYYGCKHRTMTRGHKCAYKKQIREELLDDAVAEVIVALVSKPKFASMMQEKINMKVDTSVLDQEIANHEKQLRQFYSIKSKLMEEIDSLDPDDRHYLKRKADLDDRLYRMYDKIEDEESQMIEARAKRQAIEAEKLTGDNIYKVLMYFDKLYSAMNDVERRRVMETLISEIQIYEDRQPNGQWLKSIKFKLPIIEEDMEISLDNDTHVETVALLTYAANEKEH